MMLDTPENCRHIDRMEDIKTSKTMTLISVKVPVSWAEKIDKFATRNGYVNRSEYLRGLLRGIVEQTQRETYDGPAAKSAGTQ